MQSGLLIRLFGSQPSPEAVTVAPEQTAKDAGVFAAVLAELNAALHVSGKSGSSESAVTLVEDTEEEVAQANTVPPESASFPFTSQLAALVPSDSQKGSASDTAQSSGSAEASQLPIDLPLQKQAVAGSGSEEANRSEAESIAPAPSPSEKVLTGTNENGAGASSEKIASQSPPVDPPRAGHEGTSGHTPGKAEHTEPPTFVQSSSELTPTIGAAPEAAPSPEPIQTFLASAPIAADEPEQTTGKVTGLSDPTNVSPEITARSEGETKTETASPETTSLEGAQITETEASSSGNADPGETDHREQSEREIPSPEHNADVSHDRTIEGAASPIEIPAELVELTQAESLDVTVIPESIADQANSWSDTPKAETQAPTSGSPHPLLSRPVTAAAWVRSMLVQQGNGMSMVDGWQVLEVKLDDEQGHVTVKARREDDKVSVSVGFTDPNLRALVQASAPQIERALESQYETSVDLSFFSGSGEGSASSDDQRQGQGTSMGAPHSSGENRAVPSRRPKPSTALREWIV